MGIKLIELSKNIGKIIHNVGSKYIKRCRKTSEVDLRIFDSELNA